MRIVGSMNYSYFPHAANEYLEQELDQRKMRSPSYSLRAFARDIGMSPSTLSELLNQKVGLSREKAVQIAKKIRLDEVHQLHFCDLIQSSHARKEADRIEAKVRSKARIRSLQNQMSLDHFKIISDWYHLAILELIDMSPAYGKPEKLAKALGIALPVVKQALERLVRVEQVIFDEANSFYKAAASSTSIGESVPSDAIKHFHSDLMDRAKEALMTLPMEQREFQAVIFSLRKEDESEFKKDLKKMFSGLMDKYYHKTNKDRLFALSSQMFPLMKEKNEDQL